MLVVNYKISNLEKLTKKKKETIYEELLDIEKVIGSKDLGSLEEKLESSKTTPLFTLSDDNKITSFLIYSRTDKKKNNYIDIEQLRISDDGGFEKNLFSLIDSVRTRPAYKELKWMRTWVPQDFESIKLCNALAKYGFASFDNGDGTTRFALKEFK